MKQIFTLSILLICMVSYAQVGIGTSTPDGSAILDLDSPNKGLMLPRVDNTDLVSNPSEGLMVYNKDKKAPYFHDGTSWRAMMMPLTDGMDSLTYEVLVAYGSDLPTNTYALESINTSATSDEFPNLGIFNISKIRDRSTTGFLKLFIDRAKVENSNTVSIEINVYKVGSGVPYFSYKFTDLKILAYNMSAYKKGADQIESYTILARVYGWKDHVNGISLAVDSATSNYVPY